MLFKKETKVITFLADKLKRIFKQNEPSWCNKSFNFLRTVSRSYIFTWRLKSEAKMVLMKLLAIRTLRLSFSLSNSSFYRKIRVGRVECISLEGWSRSCHVLPGHQRYACSQRVSREPDRFCIDVGIGQHIFDCSFGIISPFSLVKDIELASNVLLHIWLPSYWT